MSYDISSGVQYWQKNFLPTSVLFYSAIIHVKLHLYIGPNELVKAINDLMGITFLSLGRKSGCYHGVSNQAMHYLALKKISVSNSVFP